jgi:hypothetical protein
MSKFADFIRNASPEEKEEVYTDVMKRASEAQETSMTMPAASTGKWTIERIKGKGDYRGISIKDEKGRYVANIVFQLEEDEMKIAKLIVDSVNKCSAASDAPFSTKE